MAEAQRSVAETAPRLVESFVRTGPRLEQGSLKGQGTKWATTMVITLSGDLQLGYSHGCYPLSVPLPLANRPFVLLFSSIDAEAWPQN